MRPPETSRVGSGSLLLGRLRHADRALPRRPLHDVVALEQAIVERFQHAGGAGVAMAEGGPRSVTMFAPARGRRCAGGRSISARFSGRTRRKARRRGGCLSNNEGRSASALFVAGPASAATGDRSPWPWLRGGGDARCGVGIRTMLRSIFRFVIPDGASSASPGPHKHGTEDPGWAGVANRRTSERMGPGLAAARQNRG